MAIAFRSGTQAGSVSTSVSLTIPASVQVNDVLVAFITGQSSPGVGLNPGGWTPTGWTKIRSDIGVGGSYNVGLAVYYRVAQAGDATSVVLFQTGTSNNVSAGTMLAYSGVDTSAPIAITGATTSSSGGTSITAPSVVTPAAGDWTVEGFAHMRSAALSANLTVPSTSRGSAGDGYTYVQIGAADQLIASAGASGSRTATTNSIGSWVGVTVALAVQAPKTRYLAPRASISTSATGRLIGHRRQLIGASNVATHSLLNGFDIATSVQDRHLIGQARAVVSASLLGLTIKTDRPAQPLVRKQLGCGTYEVYVLERGGAVVGRLKDVTSIKWERVLDDVSSAEVALSQIVGCNDLLSIISPWEHELAIVRSGEPCWVGPVRSLRINSGVGTASITAKDLYTWMFRRRIVDEIEGDTDIPLTTTFKALWDSAYNTDPSPNITLVVTEGGYAGQDGGSRYYIPEQMLIAGETMQELLRTALDLTTVNRAVIVRPTQLALPVIATLFDKHWAQPPDIVIDGEAMASKFYVGSGGTGQYGPDDVAEYGDGAANRIGLVERVVSEPSIEDPDNLTQSAKTRWDLLGQQPPVYLSGGRLDASAPIVLDELVPGTRVEVRLIEINRPILTQYRIHGVSGEVSGGTEAISITLAPVGTEDVPLGDDFNFETEVHG